MLSASWRSRCIRASPRESGAVALTQLHRTNHVVVIALALFFAIAAASARADDYPQQGDRVLALTRELTRLSPSVDPREAQRLARAADSRAVHLRREYRVGGPPQFHNFLVNSGLKQRGLCHHWARDLGARLAALKLRTLVLRWGIARPGTLREHNAVVVTARGQPFERGIVLDAWRHSGRLYFGTLAGDKYPWKEDAAESFIALSRSHTAPR